MRPHLCPACALSCSRISYLAQQPYHPEFLRQRRIEGNLIQPIEDLRSRTWGAWTFARVDLHEDRIVGIAFTHERRNGGIAGESAIPVWISLNFDSPKHRREAGRGEHHIWSD